MARFDHQLAGYHAVDSFLHLVLGLHMRAVQVDRIVESMAPVHFRPPEQPDVTMYAVLGVIAFRERFRELVDTAAVSAGSPAIPNHAVVEPEELGSLLR